MTDRLGALGSRRIWAVAVLVAVIFTVLGTPRAEAHNALISTSPADGATVTESPATVVLTFNEPAIATGTKVLVAGPDGSVTDGDPKLVDTTVHQALQPGLAAGDYTVQWRVTSADGHPINGTFTFVVESDGSASTPTPDSNPTPDATPAVAPVEPDSGTGGSGWLWLLAIIPVGLAAVLGWRFSRR